MEAHVTLDMRRLPAGVRRIVRVLGAPRAVGLLEAHGGTRLRIPVHEDGVLCQIVGRDGVQLLQHEFGPGSYLDLPVAEKVVLEVRNATIRTDYAAGMSIQSLARQWGLGRKQIKNVVNDVQRATLRTTDGESDEFEPEKVEKQGDLFAGWGS
ncbi:Mor transcription activator family protein [Hydrocarboniphaga effusa]|uniref:Mor transcription activator family protein n=1 Tax=Hydrocarboniphaga effusa TaxID=243629 RepID=UPI003BAB6CE3